MTASRILILLGMALGLAACGERDIRLHDLRSNQRSPEEFSIVPNKPLETPPSFAELPPPAPGSANRADQTPLADAVAVLGGNPARLNVGDAVPAADTALIARASRFGRDGNIRRDLAATDEAFRRQRSLFSWRLVPEDQYYRAYRRFSLDPYAELARFRRAGAITPSAPPPVR